MKDIVICVYLYFSSTLYIPRMDLYCSLCLQNFPKGCKFFGTNCAQLSVLLALCWCLCYCWWCIGRWANHYFHFGIKEFCCSCIWFVSHKFVYPIPYRRYKLVLYPRTSTIFYVMSSGETPSTGTYHLAKKKETS